MVILTARTLEQFKILRISGSDLKHAPGRVAGRFKCLMNLLNVRFMRHLHTNNLDPVFACRLKDMRETVLAISLERVGIGARPVSSHAGTDLTIFLECIDHKFHMLRGVYCTQPCKYMKIGLIKGDPVHESHAARRAGFA